MDVEVDIGADVKNVFLWRPDRKKWVDIGADVKNVFLRSPDRKIGPPPHTHNIMGDAQKMFIFRWK